MDNIRKVQFRNVGKTYFPQTRVECHYNLTSEHTWASHDWIGLFKVGWSTVKEYYTYVWALVPDGYKGRRDTDCCVQFQTSYLPNPGADMYQFVYVDASGEVCGISAHFQFCTPGALDELVTLEQHERSEEEGAGEDLLMVVPKAQILQGHLEECQKELQSLKQTVEESQQEKDRTLELHKQAREELARERDDMKMEISELMEGLRHQREELEDMEHKHKDVQSTQKSLSAELLDLLKERGEQQQQIRELADDNSLLTQQKKQADTELERTKERVKKLTEQRHDEEEEKKALKAENEVVQSEVRTLKERLEASERSNDALRRELSELGGLQGHSHAELHQCRMQLAQANLQLSQANLALREGESTWAQEKEQLRSSAELDQERIQKLSRELQRKEEWLQEERAEREKLEAELGGENDSNRVQLGDARKEVQKLKASLRAAQMEKEQQKLEKQVLLEHIRELEKRRDQEVEARWIEATLVLTAPADIPPCEPKEEVARKKEEKEEEEEVSERVEPPQADTCEGDAGQTDTDTNTDIKTDTDTQPPTLTQSQSQAQAQPEEETQPEEESHCRVVEISQLTPASSVQEEEEEEEERREEETPEVKSNNDEMHSEEKSPAQELILSYLSEYPLW